ncbi:GNAT family N-acetyltransferase [Actinocatenispora sera]|uniref:GNAT family N-acetyltransferase n=1 Tax=Actinocatenispora sera TaxID=390989 RepID=UPI00340BEF70
MVYEVVTCSDAPELDEQAGTALREVWPEFIFHDPTSRTYIDRVQQHFSRFDLWLLDDGEVVAGGWGVPLRWDGTVEDLPDGYDGGLVRSVEGHEQGVAPNTLSIMAAAVASGRQGGGLAGRVLTALRERATDAGLTSVICPVRPTLKTSYPLQSMADFATWQRGDGLHLDPWIRTHQRLGATVLAPALRSMVIEGTVAEWESWTGLAFPQSGDYVVPQALATVHIDRDADHGSYLEPNLWMRHL